MVFGAAGGRTGRGRLMRGPVCIKEINYVTGLNGSTENLALPWHQLYALKVYAGDNHSGVAVWMQISLMQPEPRSDHSD